MTDNPHYITPEEAEEKTCPYDAKNWGTCMSSQCMAWRWKEIAENLTQYKDGIVTPVRNIIGYSDTYGYCGMVRS